MPRVSVIIPCYNRAHVIREAIDSVLAQTYRDYEIVVVDDASTDDSREVVAAYGDRVRLVARAANGGIAAARNDGILHSRGELVAFLDSDDLWEPRRLETAVAFLDAHPGYGAVYGDMRCVWPEGGPSTDHCVADMGGGRSGWIFEDLLRHALISTLTITIRREVLDRVGLFDESLPPAEDQDLWWRIAREAPIGFVPETVATARFYSDGLSRSGTRASRNWVRCCRKALRVFPDLTPRQRRLLHLRLYGMLRAHAIHLAREGREQEARRADWEAVRAAAAARSPAHLLKAAAVFLAGSPGRRWAQRLRARASAAGGGQ